MSNSPAFLWYPKDILASARVQEMSLAEEGAYRRLIDYCWLNGSVPADPKRCARLIGKGATVEIAQVVLEMFSPDPNDESRMIHDRLDTEKDKQEVNRIARQKASNARWSKQGTSINGNGKQVNTDIDANAMQMDSFSIAVPIAKKEGRKEPPKPPPKVDEKEESQDEYLLRKQLEHPKLDIQKVFQNFLKFCNKEGSIPKRPSFDGWLKKEHEPLEDKPPPDTKPDWQIAIEICTKCDEKGLVEKGGKLVPCKHL